MDIRRVILWISLSFSILFLWNNWQLENNNSSSSNNVLTEESASYNLDLSIPEKPNNLYETETFNETTNYLAKNSELIIVNSDVLRLTFDTHGAQIIRAELLKFPESKDSKPTLLLDQSPNLFYVIQSGIIGAPTGLNFPTHLTPFKLKSSERELLGNSLDIIFEAESNGLIVTKKFTLYEGSYEIKVSHILSNIGLNTVFPALYLQIERDGNEPPGSSRFYSTFTGIALYSEEKKFQKVSFSDIVKHKADYIRNTDNGWIAVVQHYFVTSWIPNQKSMRQNEVLVTNKNKDLFAVRTIERLDPIGPGSNLKVNSKLWIGPQDQKSLSSVSNGLELVVDYGFLTIIAKPLFMLMTFLYKILGNWGWTIVFLTILIKFLFFPLASSGYRSMERMKKLSPRINTLKEKYKDDKQKFNSAMMEVYRNEKINPLGGCLPMLVQIPVFISLYWVLLASVEMRGAPWILWISDLSVRDPLFILPTIMILTMFIQIKLNPKPPDPIQAKVMMIMPLLFGGMMFFFPAGLVLYWCVNNALSIAQQWLIVQKFS
ncbi:MAG: membrane protein insertase YidC [Bordetella sp.]|nr:MAG: membrane protein insertase YidC [Bordetella sp.]